MRKNTKAKTWKYLQEKYIFHEMGVYYDNLSNRHKEEIKVKIKSNFQRTIKKFKLLLPKLAKIYI